MDNLKCIYTDNLKCIDDNVSSVYGGLLLAVGGSKDQISLKKTYFMHRYITFLFLMQLSQWLIAMVSQSWTGSYNLQVMTIILTIKI